MKKIKYPLLIASNNEGKIMEFNDFLGGIFEKILTPSDCGLDFNVEETGKTFYENALLKAKFATTKLKNTCVLSDDSGLICNGLNGAPGVYSARYNPDGDNSNLLLKNLKNKADRTAYFECCLVLILPDGTEFTASGKTYGRITAAPIGTNGFGYDPIFYSDELGKGFGECTSEEKNSVSHRGKAITMLYGKLDRYLKNLR